MASDKNQSHCEQGNSQKGQFLPMFTKHADPFRCHHHAQVQRDRATQTKVNTSNNYLTLYAILPQTEALYSISNRLIWLKKPIHYGA